MITAYSERSKAHSLAFAPTAFGEMSIARLTPKIQMTFPYNINSRIVTTAITGSGTATQSNGHINLNTTAAASSSAHLYSNRTIRYGAGQGVIARFTAVFTPGVAGSTQIIGVGDTSETDGFFFGYNGSEFGILRRYSGTDHWIPQTEWNADLMDGSKLPSNCSHVTLDPTKGNVYQIRFQWLGYGAVSFYVEEPQSGHLMLVHRINYANQATTTSIDNPNLRMLAVAENTSNDTAITLKTASFAAFIEGEEPLGLLPSYSTSNSKSAITTQTNLFTVRNKTTYQSLPNRVFMEPVQLAIASVGGNAAATFRIIKNTTLGGTPSYSDISTNTSVIEMDTAGTTITGGIVLATYVLAPGTSQIINLLDLVLELEPGETFTISGTSSNSTTCSASLTWKEGH